MSLIINVDGGSRGNPGPAGAGVVIRDDAGRRVFEAGFFLGRQTNNAAEYIALVRALEKARTLDAENVKVLSDSELLVRQVTGEYRVKSPSLAPLFEQVQLQLLKISCWQVQHIRREQNQRADELANLAMDRQADVILFDAAAGGQLSSAAPTAAASGRVAAQPPVSAPGEAQTAEAGASPRPLVRVTQARAPRAGGCPVGGIPADGLVIDNVLPAAVCIHAAHAILPTVLAMRNSERSEFAAIPTMTVRCTNPECGAQFHVCPARSANGEQSET